MGIIDFFIKDKDSISQEAYNRTRLLVIVLISLISITFLLSILGLFGMFRGITNFMIFLVLVSNLFILKSKGNLDVTFFITALICTIFMVYNATTSGYIMSLDNKWLIIALITIFFMKPRWLTPYAIFLFLLQTCYLVITLRSDGGGVDVGLVFEEYMDNIMFFGLAYALLRLLNKYQTKQNEIILESNRLLKLKSEQLSESNEELEKFAFVVSHDLKSPLRNIISFTALLERSLKKSNISNATEYAEYIKEGCYKLDRLIVDILNYSRLETVSRSKEEIDLNELILEIKESLSNYLEELNAKIIIDGTLPMLFFQYSLMIQLLKNLIENGLKYNESETPTVTISYHSTDKENYLAISDNGIGIKDEYHDSIFKMFTRLHSSDKYEGTGIGLSTCKKIIEKVGGKISVSSKEGQGTTFKFTLPDEFVIANNSSLIKQVV